MAHIVRTTLVLTTGMLAMVVWWGYGHHPTQPDPAATPSPTATPTPTPSVSTR